jgi:hypothetical protein
LLLTFSLAAALFVLLFLFVDVLRVLPPPSPSSTLLPLFLCLIFLADAYAVRPSALFERLFSPLSFRQFSQLLPTLTTIRSELDPISLPNDAASQCASMNPRVRSFPRPKQASSPLAGRGDPGRAREPRTGAQSRPEQLSTGRPGQRSERNGGTRRRRSEEGCTKHAPRRCVASAGGCRSDCLPLPRLPVLSSSPLSSRLPSAGGL